MEPSPLTFKQALKLTIKRNVVRLVLLAICLGIWVGITIFRTGSRVSVSPHTLAKTKLLRVETPTRATLNIENPKQKEYIDAVMMSLESSQLDPQVQKNCMEILEKRMSEGIVWIRSLSVDPSGATIGRVLLARSEGQPEDLGIFQVEAGCALFCPKADEHWSDADRALYTEAQAKAEKQRLGVWAKTNQQTPLTCSPSGK